MTHKLTEIELESLMRLFKESVQEEDAADVAMVFKLTKDSSSSALITTTEREGKEYTLADSFYDNDVKVYIYIFENPEK